LALINEINQAEDTKDDIKWKFTANGEYSAASAYSASAQFCGYGQLVHDGGGFEEFGLRPSASSSFALSLQNRVWPADRLQKRGYPSCTNCQLCKRVPKTAVHILFKCRYSLRILNPIIHWLAITSFDTATWANHDSMKEWLMSFIYSKGVRTKSLLSPLSSLSIANVLE
jgi:hypothetical protein